MQCVLFCVTLHFAYSQFSSRTPTLCAAAGWCHADAGHAHRCGASSAYVSKAPKGNGIGATGSKNPHAY